MARILVIDDDKSLLQMMNLMLKRVGHDVILANNGTEGLRVAKREMPDIAIVDIMMPDVSGYDVCRELRLDPKTQEIPLLILTALSQSEPRDAAEDAGADEFITKPITRDDLVKAVNLLLRTGPRNFAPLEVQQAISATEKKPKPVKPPQGSGIFKKPTTQELSPQTTSAGKASLLKRPTEPLPAQQPQPAQPLQAVREELITGLPLVSIMGLTPGTGATALAINLSLGLMQHGRVCLVDIDDEGLRVSRQMKLLPQGTWANLINLTPSTDKRMIASALTLTHQSGVAVIAAPETDPPILPYANLRYAYTILSEAFKRIVVDLSSDLNAMTLGTLKDSSQIVLVVSNEEKLLTPAIRNLQTLLELGLTANISLILNRTHPLGLSYDQVSDAFGIAPAADVPYEQAQTTAIESGVPLLMLRPASLFSQTILYIARQL